MPAEIVRELIDKYRLKTVVVDSKRIIIAMDVTRMGYGNSFEVMRELFELLAEKKINVDGTLYKDGIYVITILF
jgi:spermidine/putrescine-binding protein